MTESTAIRHLPVHSGGKTFNAKNGWSVAVSVATSARADFSELNQTHFEVYRKTLKSDLTDATADR